MIRDYLQIRKARKLITKINKLTWWDSKLVDNGSTKRLEIEARFFDDENLLKVINLLREDKVSFWFHYNEDTKLQINVNFRY